MENDIVFIGREQLVKSVSEVVANIEKFNEDIGQSEYLICNLSMFKDWYYNTLTKQFGPKKFVGFKDMTAEKYEALKKNPDTNFRGNFDSSLTAPILKELSIQPDQADKNMLFSKLKTFLSDYDSHPKSNAVIHVVNNISK